MEGDYAIIGSELYHFGVKGMKWGIRRKRKQTPVTNKRNTYKKSDREVDQAMYIKE